MDSSLYESGAYLTHNPTWHTEDSPWKAAQVLKMLRRHQLVPKTIGEVGCGAGEILNQLSMKFPADTRFAGYDISPQAHELAVRNRRPNVDFFLKDLLEEDTFFDLLLVMDVFEHVPDYLGFLRELSEKADHFIFHIPLDLSAQTVIRGSSLRYTRESVGHLHMFTEETALATLDDTGYERIDHFFTARGVELGGGGIRRRVARLPRRLLSRFNPSLASRLLGGFSLLVLARKR